MSDRLKLEVKNLVTEFNTENGKVIAVNDISFKLNKGETLGIVGESGSGKSVTMLSSMRLIPDPPGRITGGEIIYHDDVKGAVDLVQLSDKDMRYFRGNELSMIFQEPMTSLNPVYTCGNQVVEAIKLHQNVDKEKAKRITLELFEQVQLPTPERMFKAYPHQLSGGQKQRVMIAMAMSCNPGILIADEPTTALDVTVQKTILELMHKLRDEKDMAIVFITHDLGVIAEIADRVLVMYQGKIVEQGSVLEIFENPKHPYTKGLLACRPPLGKRLSKLPVVSDFMKLDDEGNMIEKDHSVDEMVNKFLVTKDETDKRHKTLYEKKPILEVKNLKTWFPTEHTFLGRIKKYVKSRRRCYL